MTDASGGPVAPYDPFADETAPVLRRFCFWCGETLTVPEPPTTCPGCGRHLTMRVTPDTTVAELARRAHEQGVRLVFSIRPLDAPRSADSGVR